ncbi:UNVERIFIED_CONTAM: hypothetical protein FKN15_076343 [Acipenser sinensis]
MTIQLLRFADLINCDIQRYFGKKSKEEDPDACEIYEDRLSSVGRSGRERYYADLMRVAQSRGREEEGEEEEEDELPHVLRALCSRDSIQQLGPLAELFSIGLRRYVKPGGAEHARRQKGECRHGQGVPMCKRRLPPSFWAEPAPHPPACLLSATNTPDFSDLLASWTCESSQELQGSYFQQLPKHSSTEGSSYQDCSSALQQSPGTLAHMHMYEKVKQRPKRDLKSWKRMQETRSRESQYSIDGFDVSLLEAETEFVPSVQDFDKKLAEADAYLQILIDQLKLFDEKIGNCKEDEQRRGMVESVKHCIVLLQIAKSTINPVDGIYQPSPLDSSVICTMPTQTVLPPGSGPSAPSSSVTSPSHVNLSSNTVPDFSYSSSEDEFYDADEFYQTSTSPKRCIDPSMTTAVLPHSSTGSSLKRPDTNESLNSMSNGTTDADQFDSHDDRDDDGEGESVEEHKSVIMHLLSQVRLGMDLTKVVLPTFILERRSLLEMYADFFAHPDLFVSTCLMHFCDSIADQTDPRDRMVQVLKWYLSAFHAGRKGSVAKKPYNPILGEIFLCYWDLPSDNEENVEPVSEGPAPWCSKNDVSFVAEQVSHHPPISAFYAECYSKKIQFNAHIWTKSKFLGMSIGVHNIGQGCVSCLEYDEHYILTFPNGYGR